MAGINSFSIQAFALFFLLTSVAFAAEPRSHPRFGQGSTESFGFSSDGVERSYLLYRPDLDEAPAALLVVMHGGGGTAQRMRRVGFEPIADRENFVILYPQGNGNGWRDGRNAQVTIVRSGEVDDVAFLRALITQYTDKWGLTPSRVFVTGASNGGMMSFRMVCEAADILGGAAPVIASLPEPMAQSCQPSRPVPLLVIAGTQDRLVPYGGGRVADFSDDDRGRVLPVEETMRIFATQFDCAGNETTVPLADSDPNDGTTAGIARWPDCQSDIRLELITIEGGGHRWPGLALRQAGARARLTGLSTQDFDGAQTIWSFFAAQIQP